MLRIFVCPQDRHVCRLVAATVAVLFILICAPQCVGEQPTATAVITDRGSLPVSSRFGVPDQFKLNGAGDVFFTSGGNTGLFRWSQAAGVRRLLQTNDLLETLGIPEVTAYAPDGLLDVTGALLDAKAGYAAFTISAAIKGDQDPGGPLVYDGSSYRLLNLSTSTFSQLLVNASGRVAVLGRQGYWSTASPQMIEVTTDSGDDVNVALQGGAAPGIPGGTYRSFPQLIGFNDNGQLAFLAEINGGGTNLAVFLWDGTDVHLVAKQGGAILLQTGTPSYGVYYALNNNGQVAIWGIEFPSAMNGIWIGDASGADPKKVMRQRESTGIDGWDKYNVGPDRLWLRGFNDSGKVLYDCATEHGPGYALFLKAWDDTKPQVVFYRNQPGGPEGQPFFGTEQATLNNNGKVAFLARSYDPVEWGWYLGEAQDPPSSGQLPSPPSAQAIAIQGVSTPSGGTFGLAGRNSAAVLNNSNQVLFLADILDLNAVGLFSWTSDGGVRSVVSTNDSLPAGANTVLRAVSASASDAETLVRVLKAGGQATYYAKQLETGMTGLRKIVAEFDQVPDLGTVAGPDSFAMNSKGEVVFTAALLGAASYPLGGILASLPASGLRSMAFTGDAPGGGTITSFGALQLNNRTQVAFFARTAADVPPRQAGIFIASLAPPSLQKVVRTDDPWPTGTGFTFRRFLDSSLSLNDIGQVAFLGQRSGPGGPAGLLIGTAGGPLLKVVEVTDPAPSGKFDGISSPFKLNAAGQVAFSASYSSGHGVFLGSTAGAPLAIATTDSLAPGTGGAKFQGIASFTIDLNSSGQVAFWAGVCCSPGPGGGWFLGSATAPPSPRLLQNQALPGGGLADGLTPGARFAALADSGEMAVYVGQVKCCDAMEPQIVIAGADGTLRKFAISGERAPGAGSEFGKLYPTLTATPSGRFLFGAVLVGGPAKAGIFMDRP